MKIITITLNPAFDIHCSVENLQLYQENYVTAMVKHAGGKGINISRALTGFGIDNLAYCVVGDSGGAEFLSQLNQNGISVKAIMTEGRIRENITLHSGGKETRISFEGFSVTQEVLNQIYAMIEREKDEQLVVTFTGRLCPGITNYQILKFLAGIKALGAKLIVDCNSFSMGELLELAPFFIKPNAQELSQLVGYEIKNQQEAFEVAKKLHTGGIEHVIASLGSKGFVYWGKAGGVQVSVPQITPISTIGAGDSLVAGFLAGMAMGQELCDILKLAAAFGTAACLTEGTKPPKKEDVLRLEKDIIIHDIVV